MGLGADGHVASLFPKSKDDDNDNVEDEESAETNHHPPVIVTTKDYGGDDSLSDINDDSIPPRRRISLNYNTLNAAENIFVIATGKGKRDIVERLRTDGGDGDLLPVEKLDETITTFFIDDEAWNE